MEEIKKRLRLEIELQIDSAGDSYVEFKRYDKDLKEWELIREKFVQQADISECVKFIEAGDFEKALEACIKIYTRR